MEQQGHKTEGENRTKGMRFHPFVFTGKERDEKTGFGFTTTYTYDLRGRLTATAHPDKGTTTLTYDKAGNLTHKATQKLTDQGVDIEYVYDYNRLKEVHYPLLPQNNVTYTYGTASNTATNACGRLLRVDDGTGYQIFSYDKLGNVAENTRAIALPFEDSVYNFRMLFEYDTWNRVQRIVYPDSEVVTYNYDLGGNLNRVHTYKANHRDTLIKNILYDEFGHRTQVNFGNGVTTNYTYDILQRLSLLETKKPSSPALQKISYSFDLEDNITRVENTASGANSLGGAYVNTYNYDDLYRLTAANGSYAGNNTNYSLEMSYTPAGRLCSKLQDFTGTGNVYAYSPNNKPHAARRIYNGITNELSNLRWDNNGNLAQQTVYSVANNATTYQGMRYLQWDEDDRLNLVAGDGYLSYYAYGHDGNRAIKMTGNASIDQTGTLLNSTNLENITIYPNEYLTVTQAEYTKYYYAGGNRIASKIGTGGFEKMQRLCTLDQSPTYNANTLLNFVLYQIANVTNQPNDEYPVDVCGGYSISTELLTSQLPDFYISNTALNFTQNNLLQQFRQNLAGGTEAVYYFHSDHLGSASWITDGSGLPVQHLQYLPFGELFANEQSTGYNERFTFTGKERDAETGYYYHGARFNSSDIGWLSVDPMADKYPSLTPYNYCAWNPIILVDPDGKHPRIYIELNGLGHVFITTGSGENTVVYTYGRYAELYKDKSSFRFSTPVGEGVLIRLTGSQAKEFIKMQIEEKGAKAYEFLEASDKKVTDYYDKIFFSSNKIPSKGAYKNNQSARVIDNYSLLNNNCVTKTIEGIRAGLENEKVFSGITEPRRFNNRLKSLSRTTKFLSLFGKKGTGVLSVSKKQMPHSSYKCNTMIIFKI